MTSEANEGPSAKAKANGRRLQVITGASTAVLGASYLLYHQLKAQEAGEEAKKEEVKDEEHEVCKIYTVYNLSIMVATRHFLEGWPYHRGPYFVMQL